MIPDKIKVTVSLLASAGSFALEHVATILSVLSALVAIAAGLPVAVERWKPYFNRWFGKDKK